MIMKENEKTELKASLTQLKEGIISISAILNKHKKGKIIFGIKDDGKAIGVKIGKNHFTRCFKIYCRPHRTKNISSYY